MYLSAGFFDFVGNFLEVLCVSGNQGNTVTVLSEQAPVWFFSVKRHDRPDIQNAYAVAAP